MVIKNIKKCINFFTIFAVVIFVQFSLMQPVSANSDPINYSYFNTKEDVEHFFSGRTFSTNDHMVRYYFGKNGEYTRQRFEMDTKRTGKLLESGKWHVKSAEEMCLGAVEEKDGEGTIEYVPVCYDVYLDPEEEATIVNYIHPVYLTVKANSQSQNEGEQLRGFYLDHFMQGALILNEKGYNHYKEDISAIGSMKKRMRSGVSDYLKIRNVEIFSTHMREFYQDIVDMIFETSSSYISISSDGKAVLISKNVYDQDSSDINFLKKNAFYGYWLIHDNLFCLNLYSEAKNRKRVACIAIREQSDLLHVDRDTKGYLFHDSSGHSYFINEDKIYSPVGVTGASAFQAKQYDYSKVTQ